MPTVPNPNIDYFLGYQVERAEVNDAETHIRLEGAEIGLRYEGEADSTFLAGSTLTQVDYPQPDLPVFTFQKGTAQQTVEGVWWLLDPSNLTPSEPIRVQSPSPDIRDPAGELPPDPSPDRAQEAPEGF